MSESQHWNVVDESNDARAYTLRDDIGITIWNDYRHVPFNYAMITESATHFKVIFLVTIGTPVVLPYPGRCRNLQG